MPPGRLYPVPNPHPNTPSRRATYRIIYLTGPSPNASATTFDVTGRLVITENALTVVAEDGITALVVPLVRLIKAELMRRTPA